MCVFGSQALHFDAVEDVHSRFQSLHAEMSKRREACVLKLANRLYGEKTYAFLPVSMPGQGSPDPTGLASLTQPRTVAHSQVCKHSENINQNKTHKTAIWKGPYERMPLPSCETDAMVSFHSVQSKIYTSECSVNVEVTSNYMKRFASIYIYVQINPGSEKMSRFFLCSFLFLFAFLLFLSLIFKFFLLCMCEQLLYSVRMRARFTMIECTLKND